MEAHPIHRTGARIARRGPPNEESRPMGGFWIPVCAGMTLHGPRSGLRGLPPR